MARRKKMAAVTAPQTREEALVLLREYGEITAATERLEAGRKDAHAKIDSEIDAELGPHTAKLEEIHERLRIWWAGAGSKEAGGNRSVVLAGSRIGLRKTPAKVTHKGMTVAKAVQALLGSGLRKLTTVKTSLNKAALQELLAKVDAKKAEQQDQDQLRSLGFDLESVDEFFIDPEPNKRPPTAAQKEAA